MSEALVGALVTEANSAADDIAQPEQVANRTVGQTLRAAREARGASREDVAEILRFSVRQIEYIENDDYAALPGATLVRGFIRSYAKFLRLDPQALIAQLDATVPPETSDVRPPVSIGAAGDDSARFSFRRMVIAGAALLFGLIALYFFVQADQQIATSNAVPARSPEPVAPPTPVVRDVVAQEVPNAATPAEKEAEVLAVDAAGPAIVTAPEGLQMEFDDLSWVEVRDATQAVILVGEFPKGTSKQVIGKAPFALWVGRASVVRVSYQGRAVDLRASSREDVARLTIE